MQGASGGADRAAARSPAAIQLAWWFPPALEVWALPTDGSAGRAREPL